MPTENGTSEIEEREGEKPEESSETTTVESFDKWIEGQPESVKTLIATHISGLKSALESERGQRKDLNRKLGELRDKAKAGENVEAELNKVRDDLSKATARAHFYEKAPSDVSNPQLALVAADQAGLIEDDGSCDWKEMRKRFPELFRKAVPKGDAGTGVTSPTKDVRSMNAFIRRAAGRGP